MKLFKKILKLTLFSLILLVTLVGALVTIENWRGKRAWEEYRQKMEARGESLDMEKLFSHNIPDEENFGTIFQPLIDVQKEAKFRPDALKLFLQQNPSYSIQVANDYRLFEKTAVNQQRPKEGYRAIWSLNQKPDFSVLEEYYKSDPFYGSLPDQIRGSKIVIEALKIYEPRLSEIIEKSKLPHAKYNYYYQYGPLNISVPNIMKFRSLVMVLALRSLVYLDQNQSDPALRDLLTGLQIVRLHENQPFLISHLVNGACLWESIQPIWWGINRHQWRLEDLRQIKHALNKISVKNSFRSAMKSEKAILLEVMGSTSRDELIEYIEMLDVEHPGSIYKIIPYMPKGWFYQNGVYIAGELDNMTDAVIHLSSMMEAKPSLDLFDQNFQKQSNHPYRFLLTPFALANAHSRFYTLEASIEITKAGIALEEYYLKHKEYPESLEQLVPEYVAAVPVDRYDGKPLRYQRLGKASYRLYSVGPNLKDDGGVRGQDKTHADGDLVWEVGVN